MQSIKYLTAAAATLSSVVEALTQLQCGVTNMMPTVTAQIQSQGPFTFNIESNSANNLVWTTACTQSIDAASASSCSSSPTFVTQSVNDATLTGVGSDFLNNLQGGYNTTGRIVNGNVQLQNQLGTLTPAQTQNVYTVRSITDDAWNYGQSVLSGAIALSAQSQTMIQTATLAGDSGWSLETGPVTDQSFAGGSTVVTPVLNVGSGDYSTIFPAGNPQVVLTPNSNGSYPLTSVGFGTLNLVSGVPTTGYFSSLGYTNQTQAAVIAPNFQGLGLPQYLWYQVVNLLYNIDDNVSADLTCNPSVGSQCTLASSCSSYSILWTYSFQVSFTGQANYLNVPLSAFASDNNGQCDLYLQYLDANQHSQSTQIVLGAMFLQQYVNYWQYNVNTTSTTLSMQLSSTCTLSGVYIGSTVFTAAPNPFTNLFGTAQQIYVNTDYNLFQTTIGANLGFQGKKQFGVSLLGNFIQTWSNDCLQHFSGRRDSACENAPTYATQYFNQSTYTLGENTYSGADYDGYTTSGYFQNSSVCLTSSTVDYMCTIQNMDFLVADSIYQDNWNYATSAHAGNIGFGKNSPVWTILGNQTTKMFDVYLANFNSWSTWSGISSTTVTTNGIMTVGGFDPSYTQAMTHTTINPTTQGGYLLTLTEFAFGKTDTSTNTESYQSLLNSDETTYGIYANQASLALNFRGIGLPTNLFKQFNNLLSVITQGEATCLNFKSGYCVLANYCEYYAEKGLWDYDFKIMFNPEDDSNYFRIPLASFAANYDSEQSCVIFVEYLEVTQADSKQILLGGMFFQSVYAQYTLSGVSAVQIQLWVNNNALSTTYLGSAQVPTGPDTFAVQPMEINTDSNSEQNGVPTFSASITGITDANAYFLMDFTNDHTVVWNYQCNQTAFASFVPGSCANSPTLLSVGFNQSDNATGMIHQTGVFTDAKFGGYIVSGTKYQTLMCLTGGACKIIQVYSGETVSADNWLYDQDGTYGILGMGPNSPLWNGFANPDSLIATYSIELARITALTSENGLKQTTTQSNITFGSGASNTYSGKTSINITAMSNYSYALSNFAFGIVYQTENVDSSQYFQQLSTSYPVTFTTNFMGLGLPANLYSGVVTLLEDITKGAIQCDSTQNGICVLPAPCANYTAFTDYTFLFNFTTSTTGYIRVPLATFATNVKTSGGNTYCNLELSYLNTLNTQSSNIILGGMFFQEFYGVFANNYNVDPVTQTAALYVGQNQIYNAYVGNEQLETGVNPFTPTPTPTPDDKNDNWIWIIVLSVLCVLLIGGLGFAIYKWRAAAAATAQKRELVYGDEKQPLTNNFSEEI